MRNVFVCLMVVLLAGCSSGSKSTTAPTTSSQSTNVASTSPETTSGHDVAAPSTPPDAGGATAAQGKPTGLPSPSQALSTFSDFELKPMTLADVVARDRRKRAVASQLESRLRERVLSLLEEWKADKSGPRTGGTLVIQPQLQDLRVISGGARHWGARGSSYVTMTLQLMDGTTGAIIASPIISRSTSAAAGTWTRGVLDRNLLHMAVEISRQYLVDNYKK